MKEIKGRGSYFQNGGTFYFYWNYWQQVLKTEYPQWQ